MSRPFEPTSIWNTSESDMSGMWSSVATIFIAAIVIIVGTMIMSVVGSSMRQGTTVFDHTNNIRVSQPPLKSGEKGFNLKKQPEKGTTTWYVKNE